MTEDFDDRSFSPAVAALAEDQTQIRDAFYHGFQSRSDFLAWCIDASVYTFGKAADTLLTRWAQTPASLEALILPPTRKQYVDRPGLEVDEARRWRKATWRRELRPSAKQALSDARSGSLDYSNDGEPIQFDNQLYAGMRPFLEELHQRQMKCLTAFLDGFDSEEEIDDWIVTLDLAGYELWSELDASDFRRFDYRCQHNAAYTTSLLETGEKSSHHYQRRREILAAKYILPVFNLAVREAAKRAQEQTAEQHEEMETPVG